MNDKFMEQLNSTLQNSEYNMSMTENGALGYRSTGHELLDLNFAVSSMRKWNDRQIINKFMDAFVYDKHLATVWLFMARDIRGIGMGERKLFRVCLKHLCNAEPAVAAAVLPLVAEYGRWDDLIYSALDTKCENRMLNICAKQLADDMDNMKSGKPFSLLAKWMPSENTSSLKTREAGRKLRIALGASQLQYQHMLAILRAKLKVVERDMSSNKWNKINYEAVPSKANLNYNSAFLRHDETRRRKYLGALQKGEAKINSSAAFPHDIVHKYVSYRSVKPVDDPALEAMWKSLPNFVNDAGGTMVVADGSGSMCNTVDNKSRVTALEVANALAIYFAEHMGGAYHNKYITFSSRPQYVSFTENMSLRDKLRIALQHSEVANTNIEATFDLILKTAVEHHLAQDELPANVLIISDMEFDSATVEYYGYVRNHVNATLFKMIEQKFSSHGYKMPRLVFWNVASRTGTIPVKQNDLGVALVSGFSPAIAKMVLSNKTDPKEALLETLNDKRYKPVHDALTKAGI